MNVLQMITSNHIINVGVCAWLSAQVLKTLFTLLLTRRLVLERLVGAGGMPSSHSALTSSIAMAIARTLGYDSPEFGLALAFAAVVMYDAMGVRRAAGEQAKVLNKMIFEFPFFHKKGEEEEPGKDEQNGQEGEADADAAQDGEDEGFPLIGKELKEFLGHTPVEVLGGCLLGILVAMFMPVA